MTWHAHNTESAEDKKNEEHPPPIIQESQESWIGYVWIQRLERVCSPMRFHNPRCSNTQLISSLIEFNLAQRARLGDRILNARATSSGEYPGSKPFAPMGNDMEHCRTLSWRSGLSHRHRVERTRKNAVVRTIYAPASLVAADDRDLHRQRWQAVSLLRVSGGAPERMGFERGSRSSQLRNRS